MNCIYCGSGKNLTRDHVPPKGLIRRPYPNNLCTVPACKTCNLHFSKDEEYFRLIIIGLFCHTKEGDHLFEGPISRSMDRTPKLEDKLFESLNFEKNMVTADVDWKRILKIAKKISLGLEYLETGVPYDYDQKFSILFGEVDDGNYNRRFGPDFTYSRNSRATNGWEFTFFDSIRFSITPAPSD